MNRTIIINGVRLTYDIAIQATPSDKVARQLADLHQKLEARFKEIVIGDE